MPFVPVPNCALVEARMLLDSQQCENTTYWTRGAPWDVSTLTALNNAMLAWWSDFYAPLVGAPVGLTEIACTSLESATAPQVTLPPAVAANGEIAEETLPNNVSITVSFRTALRGRAHRGRNYIVGLTQPQVNGNTLAAGVSTSIVDAYLALLDVAADLSAHWVVASRFSGIDPTTHKPIPRVTGITTPINAVVIVDQTVDSQRRRLPGRGR